MSRSLYMGVKIGDILEYFLNSVRRIYIRVVSVKLTGRVYTRRGSDG
jgi:hypothetical protein